MKFSKFCYTALVDRDFNLKYSDNPFIFNRLLKGITKLKKKMDSAKTSETVYKEFKVEGIRYRLQAQRMLDNFLLLRVSQELPKEMQIERELVHNLGENIRFTSDGIYDVLQMIRNFLEQNDCNSAKEYINYALKDSSNISVKCIDMLAMFEDVNNVSFHQLQKELIQTRDIIGFSTSSIKKRIAFIFDVSPLYAKLDYRQFELALYNLTKLALVFTCIGSLSSIEISTPGNRFINIFARIPLQQNQSFFQFQLEMCTIKHIFENFGGHFDFYEQNGFLYGSGFFETAFSDNAASVPITSRLVRREGFDVLLKRRAAKKYRPIYEHEEAATFLNAPAEHLQEEWDSRVRFARQFFEGIDLETEE